MYRNGLGMFFNNHVNTHYNEISPMDANFVIGQERVVSEREKHTTERVNYISGNTSDYERGKHVSRNTQCRMSTSFNSQDRVVQWHHFFCFNKTHYFRYLYSHIFFLLMFVIKYTISYNYYWFTDFYLIKV